MCTKNWGGGIYSKNQFVFLKKALFAMFEELACIKLSSSPYK